MAQKVEVTLIDDLDGGKADQAVVFGLDGKQYVIDLSEKNGARLRESLGKYIAVARKERSTGGTGRAGARKASASDANTSDVREWARAEGYEVSERGRVAKDLIVKFQEAHN